MRLRVKHNGTKIYFEISPDDNLERLKDEIAIAIDVGRADTLKLSLNGRSELTNNNCAISSLGIVGGDLIHILNIEDIQQQIDVPVVDQGLKNRNERLRLDTAKAGSSLSATTRQVSRILNQENSIPNNNSYPLAMALKSLINGSPTKELLQLFNEAENISDALFLAVHASALETGLQIDNQPKDTATSSNKTKPTLTALKKGPGFYHVIYSHKTYTPLTCVVSGSLVGGYLMLNGAANLEQAEPHQLSLQLSDYTSNKTELSKGPEHVYTNLKDLSNVTKDQFFNHLLNEMSHKSHSSRTLLNLPSVLQITLFSHLDVMTLLKISQTCKSLNAISCDESLWHQFCQRDYPQYCSDGNNTSDWRNVYRQAYVGHRTNISRERTDDRYYEPSYPFDPFGNPISGMERDYFQDMHPQFPGMIGGHHDLHPTLPYSPGGQRPFGATRPLRLPRARFDPFGPLPEHNIYPRRPNRGGRFGGPPRFI